MDSVGDGEGGKIWENGIETCKMDWGQEEKGTTEDEMAGWHH